MYNLKVSKKQLEVISAACDLLARLRMGQVCEAFEYLPYKEDVNYGKVWEIKKSLSQMLPEVLVHGVDGYSSSLGVGSPDLHKDSNIAVDIHQVIRHKLSWERAVEKGTVESEGSGRDWSEMMGVSYDTPFHWGEEELCKVEKVNET